MSIATFNEFLKTKRVEQQIESASKLITLTGFPIREFSDWYKESGVCLKLDQNQRILKESIWDSAMSGAGYGAAGGTLAGGPVGTALGATGGFLAGAAKSLIGSGIDWYNKWRDPKGYYEKGFKKQKLNAAKILMDLKKFSQEMAKAGVAKADENFIKLVDSLIIALQDLGSTSPAPSTTPTNNTPPIASAPPNDEKGGAEVSTNAGDVTSPEDIGEKIETIRNDDNFKKLLSDISAFSTRVALSGKTPEETQALKEKYFNLGVVLGVEEEELARAVLMYSSTYDTSYEDTLKGLKEALIVKTDDPIYQGLLSYAKSLGYDEGYILDKFQDLILSNIINGEDIDQPEAARELIAYLKSEVGQK